MPGARQVAIPRLLHVGAHCLPEVGGLLAQHGFPLAHVLVGSGPGPSRRFADAVAAGLERTGARVTRCPELTGRLDQAAAAAATIIEEGVTAAVAVGGGRAIDVLKLAAARTGIDFVSVPTTISNDGISSPVASLVGRDGRRSTHSARMPCGVVVDVAAVGSAPAPTVRAGAADLVSNLTACMDWRLADQGGEERYDAYSAMIAESAARPVLDLEEVASRHAHEVLAHGLLLSGLAMATAGTSRPCSGAEHLVSHALDARLGARAALHGEQVALGCLVSAAAHEVPLLGQLRTLFARIGLPTRPEHLGLSRELLVTAVAEAAALRPERWTILSARPPGRRPAAELVDAAFGPAAPPRRVRAPRPFAQPAPASAGRTRSTTRPVA
ncbi:MAG TPA: iron-containing alcohol dehydrogenase [Miltoncostaeaceae bacterium]|nr:iron-containing alcohol dehydrogenase [Miltoncostaeaceae bacterium]